MKRILYDVARWHVYLHRNGRGMKSAEQDDGARLRFEDELFAGSTPASPRRCPRTTSRWS
jgi:hypothetical protein